MDERSREVDFGEWTAELLDLLDRMRGMAAIDEQAPANCLTNAMDHVMRAYGWMHAGRQFYGDRDGD